MNNAEATANVGENRSLLQSHGDLARLFVRHAGFLQDLPRFLRQPLDVGEAKETIRRRLASRAASFLQLAKTAVYDRADSPYRPLLRQAGCDYADLEAGVKRHGLEGMLSRLLDAGVWVALEEFKGRRPIRRGGLEVTTSSESFENPLVPAGYGVSTGGSTGRSTRTRFALDFLAARACYDAVQVDMLNMRGMPLAIWYPSLPASTGIANTLRYTKVGCRPQRWFNMLTDVRGGPGLESRLAQRGLLWVARLAGRPLPRPEPTGLVDIGRVVDWVVGTLEREGRCAFQSYVSHAVRVCGAARARRQSLAGLQIVVGSEPLTATRSREITATGATVYPRYMATEAGTIAMGCGNPAETDEMHLVSDTLAAIRPADSEPGEPAPLYLSSLIGVMPKIMINVQLGDMGLLGGRACGCDWEALGLTTHLSCVRSCERACGEGMAVNGTLMARLIDEVFPARYGGTSVDYQWVETESEGGMARLQLRIAPDLGPVDEGRLVQDVLEELHRMGEGERLMAEVWRQAGTVMVVREAPRPTARGKMLPMLVERARR